MKIETAKILGQSVRERRKALDLTQRDLADFAGCSELFIVQLEAGKPTVRLDKTLDVLEALGLRLRVEPGRGGIVA